MAGTTAQTAPAAEPRPQPRDESDAQKHPYAAFARPPVSSPLLPAIGRRGFGLFFLRRRNRRLLFFLRLLLFRFLFFRLLLWRLLLCGPARQRRFLNHRRIGSA